jgi:hypothetical protein
MLGSIQLTTPLLERVEICLKHSKSMESKRSKCSISNFRRIKTTRKSMLHVWNEEFRTVTCSFAIKLLTTKISRARDNAWQENQPIFPSNHVQEAQKQRHYEKWEIMA